MAIPRSTSRSIPSRSRRGSVAEVAMLAYPAVLHTLSDTLMHTVDSILVGRLGVAELGGVGLGGIWLWTLVVPFVGAANGVQTFAAQAYGAGRLRECGHWLWQAGLVLCPLMCVWALLIAMALPAGMTLSGTPQELSELATDYVLARLPGTPLLIGAVAATAFLRALGDTRSPFLAAVLAHSLNVVLSVVLVFGLLGLPKLGVVGAGIGTSCANFVHCALLLAIVLRPRMRAQFATAPVPPALAGVGRYFRTSLPLAGQWFLDMLSFAVFSTLIAHMGAVAMAASQAMIQLLSLSFMQAYGISTAAAALVGRYVGRRDYEAAERAHWSALKLGALLALLVAALFLTVPETLLRLFTSDPQVLAVGRRLLALGALFQLLDAVGIVTSGSLRGAGDTRVPFLLQALLAWFLRLPLVVLIAIVCDGGVVGAWVAELLYVATLGALWLWRFRTGAWRTIEI